MPINPRYVAEDLGTAAPRHRAELKIFLDGHPCEGPAPFRHMRYAKTRDVLGGAAGKSAVAEPDLAAAANHAAERAQRRRLAGAVGAEQGDDAALAERKIDAVERLVRPVEGAQSPSLKHHG
jgi:hypothetical protein